MGDQQRNGSDTMQFDSQAMSLLKRLVDESDVRRILSDLDHAVDAKDWERARNHFDADITLELPTFGGASQTMKSDDFMKAVAASNFAQKKTYHGAFNPVVTVDGDAAELRFHMYGWNLYREMTPDFWEVWGQFLFRLRRTGQGWKIVYLKQSVFHERGNPAVGAAKAE
jgi:hypothetical protein